MALCAYSFDGFPDHEHFNKGEIYVEADSVSPSINLEVNDYGRLATSQVEVEFNPEGIATLQSLKVLAYDQFAIVRIGYGEDVVYGDLYQLPEGTQQVEITLKASGDLDWSDIFVGMRSILPAGVRIGNYPLTPVDSVWSKVSIPMHEFDNFEEIQYMFFNEGYNDINYHIKEIKFTGGEEDLVWFGPSKFDNGIRSPSPTDMFELIIDEGLPVIEEVRLEILNHNREITKTLMPFSSMDVIMHPGENLLRGVLIDEYGGLHYSDTVSYTVSSGISVSRLWHVSCSWAADGQIHTTVDGGTPPYTYAWSHGASTKDVSGLPSGIYTVTVTDANGKTASTSAKIEEPVELSATLNVFGCEGRLEASGGTAPYYYAIDGGSYLNFGSDTRENVWEVVADHDPDDNYHNMAVELQSDGANNIYVGGNYNGKLDFTGNPVGTAGNQGIYVVKLNSKGDLMWGISSQVTNPAVDMAELRDMAVSTEGDVFFAFYTPGGNIEASDGTYGLGEGDYLAKVTSAGMVDWIIDMPKGVGHIGLDGFNNVYVSGKISDIFFSLPEFDHIKGPSDLYLAQYTENGVLHWVVDIEGRNSERIEDLAVADNGDAYITGAFETDISFGDLTLESSGYDDMFIAKYNAIGALMWARKGGGTGNYDVGTALTLDDQGSVYLGFTLGSHNSTFGNEGFGNPLVVLGKLKATDGSTKWTNPIVFMDNNSPDGNAITGIAVDKFPFVYVTGVSEGRVVSDYYLDHYQGAFMMSLNADGGYFERTDLSYTPYYSKAYPITSTNDDYIIYANYDEFLSIAKFGLPQKTSIELAEGQSTITVMDAHSCLFEVEIPDTPSTATVPEICYVTTSKTANGVKIFWDTDGFDEVDHYKIYKEDKAFNDFKVIGTAESDGVFYDTLANIHKRSYRYRVSAVASCGKETSPGAPHKTMHLTVSEGNKGQVNLIWDRYEGFDYPSFKILRGTSPDQMQYLDQVSSNLYTYTDVTPPSGSLYYQIVIDANVSGTPVGCGLENGSETTGRLADAERVVGSNIASRFGKAGNLSFYPNPSYDRINLRFNPDGDEYQLKLIDAAGRVVR
ncbi:hypothetical protein E1163_01485, partial [Fulvivirga kasyanovii]|nr:hypothetical protein [Fulvivirga kasyanovii]